MACLRKYYCVLSFNHCHVAATKNHCHLSHGGRPWLSVRHLLTMALLHGLKDGSRYTGDWGTK